MKKRKDKEKQNNENTLEIEETKKETIKSTKKDNKRTRIKVSSAQIMEKLNKMEDNLINNISKVENKLNELNKNELVDNIKSEISEIIINAIQDKIANLSTSNQSNFKKELLKFFENLISKDNGEMLRSIFRYQAELNNEVLLDKIDSINETYGLGRGLKIILDKLISLFKENGLKLHYNFGEEIKINKPEDLYPFEFRGEPFKENEEKIVRIVDVGVSFDNNLLLKPIVEKVKK